MLGAWLAFSALSAAFLALVPPVIAAQSPAAGAAVEAVSILLCFLSGSFLLAAGASDPGTTAGAARNARQVLTGRAQAFCRAALERCGGG
jgi:hypothetical protein